MFPKKGTRKTCNGLPRHCRCTVFQQGVFFFPPHLFPRLSVALHDCFTGQSPGARLARRARRAKVQGPGKLRQGGEATGGRRVWRGFRQELAPVDGIGVDVVEIGCSFTKKGGCEGGHLVCLHDPRTSAAISKKLNAKMKERGCAAVVNATGFEVCSTNPAAAKSRNKRSMSS